MRQKYTKSTHGGLHFIACESESPRLAALAAAVLSVELVELAKQKLAAELSR